MPDYQEYVAAASGDRSIADIRWAMRCISLGFPELSVAAQLELLSGKAQGRSDNYPSDTAANAARFVGESASVNSGRERMTI